MKNLNNYLISKHIVPEKNAPYYIAWVSKFYAFCGKKAGSAFSSAEVDQFLKHLSKSREEWQVKQAKEAIGLYSVFMWRRAPAEQTNDLDADSYWKKTASEMVRMLRLKHRALATERTYIGWLRDIYRISHIAPDITQDRQSMSCFCFRKLQ